MSGEVSERLTRHVSENAVMIPYVNINVIKASFSYQGPKLWNNLPYYMKECAVMDDFKRKPNMYFLSL